MHTVGKVFLGLTIVTALATAVLATKLLQKRNDITQKLDALKKDNEKLAADILTKREDLRRLKEDYDNVMRPWDRYWNDRQVNVQPTGAVAINVGTNEGMGTPVTPEKPVIHLYIPSGDGTHIYAGPFQTEQINEAATSAKPAWHVRPSDIALMKPGMWRVRTQCPPVWVNHFHALQTELTLNDELLAAKQKNLALQNLLVEKQKEHLEIRKQELLGYKDLPPKADQLGPEFTKGLESALADEDEARNKDLAVVDKLRNEVREEFRLQQKLVAQVQGLVASLPGGRPAATSTGENTSAALPKKSPAR